MEVMQGISGSVPLTHIEFHGRNTCVCFSLFFGFDMFFLLIPIIDVGYLEMMIPNFTTPFVQIGLNHQPGTRPATASGLHSTQRREEHTFRGRRGR